MIGRQGKGRGHKIEIGKDRGAEVSLDKKVEAQEILAQHKGVIGADVKANGKSSQRPPGKAARLGRTSKGTPSGHLPRRRGSAT
jgi:hypothetical protein